MRYLFIVLLLPFLYQCKTNGENNSTTQMRILKTYEPQPIKYTVTGFGKKSWSTTDKNESPKFEGQVRFSIHPKGGNSFFTAYYDLSLFYVSHQNDSLFTVGSIDYYHNKLGGFACYNKGVQVNYTKKNEKLALEIMLEMQITTPHCEVDSRAIDQKPFTPELDTVMHWKNTLSSSETLRLEGENKMNVTDPNCDHINLRKYITIEQLETKLKITERSEYDHLTTETLNRIFGEGEYLLVEEHEYPYSTDFTQKVISIH